MRRVLTITAAAALLAACASAAPAPASTSPTPPAGRPAGYLAKPVDGIAILGAPPAAGSAAAAADEAAIEATRAVLDTPRGAQAVEDVKLFEPGALRSWSCAAGIEIGPQTTPVLHRLLLRSLIDAGMASNPPKEHYRRDRPFIGNQRRICVAPDSLRGSTSYPSGHSSVGFAWGLILAEVVPARADALLTRGREFGDSRVICGVHYPTDVEAGRVLGAATVARLHADPVFAADLAAAKAEVAGAPPAADCSGPKP